MDHDRIVAADTIGRYLRDDLSAGEAEAFEQHYLTCQQCLDELSGTQVLRQGLSDLVQSGHLQHAAEITPRRAWYATPVWAAAATVLLAVSLLVNGILLGTSGPAASPASAEVFNLVTVRDASGQPVNTVAPAALTETVVLVIDTGRLDDGGPFAATLVPEARPGDHVRWSPLPAGPDGRIAVSLPVSMLSAGVYRIDVTESEATAVLNSARFVWTGQ